MTKRLLSRRWPLGGVLLASLVLLMAPGHFTGTATAEEVESETLVLTAEAVEARLAEAAAYLASDELEGRGVGTEGLNKAADYIAEQFRSMGLKTEVFGEEPFQRFTMSSGAALGEVNEITLLGPSDAGSDEGESDSQKISPELSVGFTPLALGGSAELDLPLVFAGYGITAPEHNYDDYADLDVEGKAVIVLRHEPQQADEDSPFDGTKTSQHAPLVRKISNAYEHGAAAVIFVSSDHHIRTQLQRRRSRLDRALTELEETMKKYREVPADVAPQQLQSALDNVNKSLERVQQATALVAAENDPLLGFESAGSSAEGRDLPVLHLRREVVDQLLKNVLETDLATLEQQIDEGLQPRSAELDGWRISGQVSVDRKETEVRNVAAILEGSGPLADETIVIGAHYDHVGYGGAGSLAPGSNEIHNGADDNASGTTALLEVARQLAARGPLPRRVVFIAFTAEELGLIGSARYVREPGIPLEQTVAMLNMDMVGRLKDNKLLIQGTGTAEQFDELVETLNENYGFELGKTAGGFGPSDHSSFYAKKIPVLHFFTGLHQDYHRPSDDIELLNIPGIRQVTGLVVDTAVALAEADEAPQYVSVGAEHGGHAAIEPMEAPQGERPYFGSIPDFSQDREGYALTGVTDGGPAANAGMQAGDIIIRLGESKIGNLADFDSALRKFKGGDTVPVVVQRGEEELTVQVKLEDPR